MIFINMLLLLKRIIRFPGVTMMSTRRIKVTGVAYVDSGNVVLRVQELPASVEIKLDGE